MAIKEANGSHSQIGIAEMDPDYADVAPTAPQVKKVLCSTFDIKEEPTTVQSASIRSDRRSPGYIQTGKNVSGSLSFECRNYFGGANEPLLRSALFSGAQSDIDTTNGASVDIEGAVITASGSTINFAAATVNPDNITNYQKIKLVNTTSNDGIYTAVLLSGSTYTLTPAVTADETCPAGSLAKGRMIRDDSTNCPLFVEKGYTDLANPLYKYFIGLECNTYGITIPTEGIVTCSAALIGLDGGNYDTTSYPDATYTETSETTTPVIAASKNISFYINDSAKECLIIDQKIDINNKLTGLKSAGKYGTCKLSSGNLEVSMDMNIYFIDSTYKDRLFNETTFSAYTVLEDKLGATTVFTFPQLKMKSDDTPTSSAEAITEAIKTDAEYSSTYGCKIQIDQFSA